MKALPIYLARLGKKLMTSDRESFGHYDQTKKLSPWHEKKIVMEFCLTEVEPSADQSTSRRFLGELKIDGQTTYRVAHYDAQELVQLSAHEHGLNFAQEMERYLYAGIGSPRAKTQLKVVS